MKYLIGIAIAALAAGSALAADMPVKPRPNLLVYPGYEGSGFYWGAGIEAGVAQSKVSGSAFTPIISGDLTAAGGAVGGTIGYMTGMRGLRAQAPGTTGNGMWAAFELSVFYENVTATDPGNVTMRSRWRSEQAVKLGGFQQPLAWLANLGLKFPVLPDVPVPAGFNIAANSSHPYVKFGAEEFGLSASAVNLTGGNTWAAAPMVGAGVLNQLLDANGALGGAVLDVGAKAVFASKGVSFNLQGGAQAAKLEMGNQYWTYAKVLF